MKRLDLGPALGHGPYLVLAEFRCHRERKGDRCGRLMATLVDHGGQTKMVSAGRAAPSVVDVASAHAGVELRCDRHGAVHTVAQGELTAAADDGRRAIPHSTAPSVSMTDN